MKAYQLALKDMKQAFRSLFALAFMFLIPILITTLFSIMFNGGGDEDQVEPAFQLSVIPIQLVNQDQGQMGALLADILSSEALSDFLDVTQAGDEVSARQAVDQQDAQVAVIIPADFSAALSTSGLQTEVELYQDPTLSIGPGIVETIINQFMISFTGSQIMLDVADTQFSERGVALSQEQVQYLIGEYTRAVQSMGGESVVFSSQTPAGDVQPANAGMTGALGVIMGGMTIFYTFFTGTYASNSILKEEEEGTLARLFSTATPHTTILAGKLLAAAMMIAVQLSVLLLFGWLVFNVSWGSLAMLVLFVLATTIGAATFGLFAISLAKDRRQAGAINGAGVTVTGMLGMADLFMMSSPAPNQTIKALSLLVPQGWANQGLLAISDAQPVGDILLYLGGLLVWSAVMFYFGFRRFKNRFA
jgi:ABC-2 type transport system permease protein